VRYQIYVSLLCLTLLFSSQFAFSQTISTDRSVYDVHDTITITFSYGKEKDLGAFVAVYPVKNGAGTGRYYSNAYDQTTGTKVISDHRFSAGEFESVLFFANAAGDLPPVGGRVIARTSFRIINCGDEGTSSAENKRYEELYHSYANNPLPQEIADYIELFTGPKAKPSLKDMPALATKLQERRALLTAPLYQYKYLAISYMKEWKQWRTGLGLYPSKEDKTNLDNSWNNIAPKVEFYNQESVKLHNATDAFLFNGGKLEEQFSALLANLKSDNANLVCPSDARLSALISKWTNILNDLQKRLREVPKLSVEKVEVPASIDSIRDGLAKEILDKENEQAEATRKYLLKSGFIDCLEMIDPPSFVLVKILEACGVVEEPK
jgi:hypothetical protein